MLNKVYVLLCVCLLFHVYLDAFRYYTSVFFINRSAQFLGQTSGDNYRIDWGSMKRNYCSIAKIIQPS